MKTTKNNTKKASNDAKKRVNKKTKNNTISSNKIKQNVKKDYNISILLLIVLFVIAIIIIFVLNKDGKWVQKGNVISRGNERYEIGDYYDYDESNGGKITNLKDVKWKILGIDENGNLLIMSASSVGDLTLGNKNDLSLSQRDYLEGGKKVNDLTKGYDQGKGAISVRSFTNKDLITLSNYSNKVEGEKYTYYWIDDTNPMSINQKGEEVVSKLAHNSNFIWYDESTNSWKNTQKNGNETRENPVKITSAINTLLSFSNDANYTGDYFIEPNSKAFNMVYLEDNGERAKFWSDVSFVNSTGRYIAYGQNIILYNVLNYRIFVYSSGNTMQETAGVRAVVTID